MRILLTGANGYIGSRLLPVLAEEGHHIVALVRSDRRLNIPEHLRHNVTVIVADLLNHDSLRTIPTNIDIAYYLVHSMGEQVSGFQENEATCARNFCDALKKTSCKQLIYLSGLASSSQHSEHMTSRQNVEKILAKSNIPLTTLRASVIIGSGSASFEIIRDLVEKLPIMVAPRWVRNQCQPIAIGDVIYYLKKTISNEKCIGKLFEIGGPQQLTYHQMLMKFAKVRGLRRLIIPVPVLTPRLSSYWLFFVTSTSFPLAQALVDSLKTDSICSESSIEKILPHQCKTYEEALGNAFDKIEQKVVIASWRDAIVRSKLDPDLTEYIEIPTYGCITKTIELPYTHRKTSIETLWRVGGNNGWYSMHWAWKIRGLIDRLIGGIGLRRGRTHSSHLENGCVLDFWRVLRAEKKKGHLLLFAEMKVPGDAWLEFRIEDGSVKQTATFRPKGILGRIYWYMLVPFHYFVFHGLCSAIAKGINPGKSTCKD